MKPKEAEDKAQRWLEKKYGNKTFAKKNLAIGRTEWEFDLVSDDASEGSRIVAEVKTRKAETTEQQFITVFKRGFIFDCLKLEKVKARKKYFFLATSRDVYNKFIKKAEGLICDDVEFIRLS